MEKQTPKKLPTLWIVLISICGILVVSFLVFLTYTLINNSRTSTSTDYSAYKGGVYLNAPVSEEAVNSSDQVSTTSEDKSIIRRGYVNFAVDNIDDTVSEIEKLKTQHNGDITNLVDSGKNENRYVSIVLKVEASKFDEVYASIKAIDGEDQYSSISEDDVTDSVTDMQARLSNLRSVEAQYVEILKTAKTVTDTLAVQRELATVRGDIESLEASLKNVEREVDYSTITIYISQSSTGISIEDEKWQPLGVAKQALSALVEFIKFIGSGIIWVLIFSPIIVAVVVPVVLILKKAKR